LYVIKKQLNKLFTVTQPTKTLLTRPHFPTLGSKTAKINLKNLPV